MTNSDPWGLRPSEIRTVEFLCDSGRQKTTAAMLNVSTSTVNDRLKTIYRKIGVNNKASCVGVWMAWRKDSALKKRIAELMIDFPEATKALEVLRNELP